MLTKTAISSYHCLMVTCHYKWLKQLELPWSDGKASAYSVGDPGSIPGSGSSPGEGNVNPLQYSCWKNSMGGGTW